MFRRDGRTAGWRLVLTAIVLAATARAADAAYLAWDPPSSADLGGYVVSYGYVPGVYVANVDVGNVTTWTVPKLTPGTYYFAVRAYTTGGVFSGPSNEVVWIATSTGGSPGQAGTPSGSGTPSPTTPDPSAPDGTSHTSAYVPPQITWFSAGTGARRAAGSTVRVTARAIGGTDPLQFRFWVAEPGRDWRVLQDYGALDSAEFLTTAPGRYRFRVWARSAGSLEDYESSAMTAVVAQPAPLRVQLAADRASRVAPSVPITLTATATGTADPVEYRFWAYDSSKQLWTALSGYSRSRTLTWTPTSTGRQVVQVWARRVGAASRAETRSAPAVFDVAPASARLVSVKSNQRFPLRAQSPISLTVAATGGRAALEYQFARFEEGTGRWEVVQPYGSDSTLRWTPADHEWGRYRIRVSVRSAGLRGAESAAVLGPVEIVP